ncbi:hypothetical protein DPMN_188613 [Dreissena polymorpha]|uniref:Uncharacterized protein n=1 Tax=Dreissena polymorpha TaxID=45954 RepID=A0A9D4DRL7_DREPO|nr:hypothetical protein DPMN_188613 [Dreissena polymorpha]
MIQVGFQGGSEGGGSSSGGEGAFSQGSQTFSQTVGAPFEQGSNANGAIEAAGIDFVVFPVNTEPVAGPAQSEVKTISQTVRISNVRPTNTANNVKRVQTFSQSGGGGAALNSSPQAVNNVEATVMTGGNSVRFDEPPASSSRDIDNVEGTMQTGSVSIMLNRPTDTVSTSQTGNNFEAAVQTEREARIVNIPTVSSSKGSNTVEVTVQSGGGSRILNVPTVNSSKGSTTLEATFTSGGDSRMLNIPNVSSSQAVNNVETTVITGNDARTFNGPSQSTSRAINNIEATVIRGSDARIANRPSENVSTSQGMAKIQSTSRTGSGGTFTINSSANGGNTVFTSERKDQPVSGSRNVVTIKQSVQVLHMF